MKYNLLVIDVDGTLVDKHGRISEEDKRAIARLSSSGVRVSLCTGRIVKACAPIIQELKLENSLHIFFDGALIYNMVSMRELYARPLEPELVREAVEFSRKNNTYLELYSRDTFFAEETNWSDEVHRKFFRVEPKLVDFSGIWERERILKAEMVRHNEKEAVKVKLFQDAFDGRFRFSIARAPAYPEIDFINIVNPAVSKGEALRMLAAELGVHRSETIAIGDGLNDIPLLQAAGVAVAMGNAFPEVKEVVQYTTDDIEHHGVASAIAFFFPV